MEDRILNRGKKNIRNNLKKFLCGQGFSQRMSEVHMQYSEKVNVCTGIVGDHIIVSFFVDDLLHRNKYLAMFQNNVVKTLANIFPYLTNIQASANTWGSSISV